MEWNKNKKRNQWIKQLRSEGKSIRKIAEIVGCAKSVVSYHCRNTQHLPQKQGSDGGKFGAAVTQKQWQSKVDDACEKAKQQWTTLKIDPTFMAFLGLYWGEGYKANKGVVGISNNDPYIIKSVADYIGPLTSKIPVATITYYPSHNPSECMKFWKILLPKAKITLKPNNDRRSKSKWCDRCPRGRCCFRFSDYKLYWSIITWINCWKEEMAKTCGIKGGWRDLNP